MANYRLLSTPMVSTPGLVAWGIDGYHFPRDRRALERVFVDGYGLPRAAAKALLSGAVPFTVDAAETVSFTYPAPRLTQAAADAVTAATGKPWRMAFRPRTRTDSNPFTIEESSDA